MNEGNICQRCGGSGLLPFYNAYGKLVPNARLDCECKKDEPERFYKVTPDMFDFPISYDFYRSLCKYHGWADPGPDMIETPAIVPAVDKPAPAHSQFLQLRAEVSWLRSKVTELEAKRKSPKGQY